MGTSFGFLFSNNLSGTMKHTENLVVVVHLSATAVYAVIGDVVSAKDIRILGVGQVKNNDFYQGQIKHRERLQGAIKQAIQKQKIPPIAASTVCGLRSPRLNCRAKTVQVKCQ